MTERIHAAEKVLECPVMADTVEKLGTWAEVTLRVKH
jgi:hypothetical protein